jgi:hypothetical protein
VSVLLGHCVICDAGVSDPISWVDLQDLPRLWFCEEHRLSTGVRFIRTDRGRWLYVRGATLTGLGLPAATTDDAQASSPDSSSGGAA